VQELCKKVFLHGYSVSTTRRRTRRCSA
jgi:hypothetical protein